jgi:hypothetical protein
LASLTLLKLFVEILKKNKIKENIFVKENKKSIGIFSFST